MLEVDGRALRVVWTVFLFGLLLALVYFIRDTILLFAGAIFFAYMLSPLVALVERFIPRRRNLALALVYILLIGILTAVGFQVVHTCSGSVSPGIVFGLALVPERYALSVRTSLGGGSWLARIHSSFWSRSGTRDNAHRMRRQ